MRTLDEIVHAVRSGGSATHEELRLAVVAFDVLLARLDLPLDPVRLQAYFVAAESVPAVCLGDENHPDSPKALEWYRAMRGVGEKCHDCGLPLFDGTHSECLPF